MPSRSSSGRPRPPPPALPSTALVLERIPNRFRYFVPNVSNDEVLPDERGLRDHEKKVVKFISEQWIKRETSQMKEAFKEKISLDIYATTYNVNGKRPGIDGAMDLKHLLVPSAKDRAPDIYVCGFQEIIDLNKPLQVINESVSRDRADIWTNMILNFLNHELLSHLNPDLSKSTEKIRYVCLAEKHLVGIMICVFAKGIHIDHIPRSEISVSSTATGILGFFGNKGGVGVRMKAYNNSLCFLCAHFAAHRSNVAARNNDYHAIFFKSTFKLPPIDEEVLPFEERMCGNIESYRLHESFSPDVHDFIIFLGDFNYRINVDCPDHIVFKAVKEANISFLLEQDQLNIERKKDTVFNCFVEPEIQFIPTYKYIPGTNILDVVDEDNPGITVNGQKRKKIRVPAWCDRILYSSSLIKNKITSKDSIDDYVSVHEYSSRTEHILSDHLPVVSHFKFNLSRTNFDKRIAMFSKVLGKLYVPPKTDKVVANSEKVDFLATTYLDFQEVAYFEKKQLTVKVTNNKTSSYIFRLIPKNGSHVFLDAIRQHPNTADIQEHKHFGILKPFYSMNIEAGVLLPNESAEIVVNLFIDRRTLKKVLFQKMNLKDSLIIRFSKVEFASGENEPLFQDILVDLKATLKTSCFGKNLSELSTSDEDSTSTMPIPKVYWILFNYILENDGFQDPNLFKTLQRSGSGEPISLLDLDKRQIEEDRSKIRSALIYDIQNLALEGTNVSNNAVMLTILELLSLLKDPVVGMRLLGNAAVETVEEAHFYYQQILKRLSSENRNMFLYVLLFVKELLKPEYKQNEMNPTFLSSLFANILLRPQGDEEKNIASKFLQTLITSE